MSSSDASASGLFKSALPQSKKLYWKETGDNNLVDWIYEVPIFAKGNFGMFGDVLYEEKVPDEWVNDFEAPAPTRANDNLAAKRLEIQLAQHMATQVQWRDTRSKFVSFLLDCCTESSIRRVQAQYKNDFEKAMRANDVLAVWNTLKKAHTYRGKTASMEDIRNAKNEHNSFAWKSPETLPQYKERWDRLMKRLANLGIKIEDVSEKDRMFSFAGALRYYGHSSEVRSKCIN